MELKGCLKIILIISLAFLGLYLLQNMSAKRATNMNFGRENFSELETSNTLPTPKESNYDFPQPPTCNTQMDDMYQGNQKPCFPKSQLTPDDLLPTSECNVWSKSNPYGSGALADRNFLQAGWATGVSSVGSTLRNANLQLRSEPPNPQVQVSPWMESTIQPDMERKPLELGGCS